jgi:hypothetical protein
VAEQQFTKGIKDLPLRLLALRRVGRGGYSWQGTILASIRQ